MKEKIGIITYHAAYNFGSQLQAFATQRIITELGYDNDIINYRLPNQIHYYGDLVTTRFGWQVFIKRSLWFSETKQRKIRAKRYENFINTKFQLGNQTFHTYEELQNADLDYSILLVGSDQVWNEHCVAEFWTEPPQSIRGYFLDFENNKDIKRIAFSSSIGAMTEYEISKYLPQLSKFQSISVREKETADLLSRLLDRNVINTIDPTLMLNREEWCNELLSDVPDEPEKNYVLLYTLLKNPVKAIRFEKQVKAFAKERQVICLSPFIGTHIPGIIVRNDAGPIEFLQLLKNADCVVTDSFHGTAFSVNFGKPFYSINPNNKDKRKSQLLDRVGLGSQFITDQEKLLSLPIPDIDFSIPHLRLAALREESLNYLKSALAE